MIMYYNDIHLLARKFVYAFVLATNHFKKQRSPYNPKCYHYHCLSLGNLENNALFNSYSNGNTSK